MKPAAFRYHRPATLEDALGLLAEHGGLAKPIAGGQSLVPMMNLRLAQPAELVDIGALEALRTIRRVDDVLEIGALVRHHELESDDAIRDDCPLLALAAATIGHYAIRRRGTVGGSLAHADPAAQLPLAFATLDAEFVLASVRGRRVVASRDFFVGVMTTSIEPDELLVAVRVARRHADERAAFASFARRQGDFAIVAVALTLGLEHGRVARLALGVGGVAPRPFVSDALVRAQRGRQVDDRWVAEFAGAVSDAVDDADLAGDQRVPAEYRRELIGEMTVRALGQARERLGEAA